jgi:hypothetical protein
MHEVVETEMFLRAAKLAGISDDERSSIVDMIAAAPEAGDIIRGTGGARKVRVAAPGRGKSGGYRVIHYFGGGDIPVYLFTVYGKGDRADLSADMRDAIASVIEAIKKETRQ